MVKSCIHGEICGDSGLTESGSVCTCRRLKKARARYINAGFPSIRFDLDAESALKMVHYHAITPVLIRRLGKCVTLSPAKLLVLKNRGVDPFPLACWFARHMALTRDVVLTNVGDVITDLFNNRGVLESRIKNPKVGLVIRLGTDTRDHRFIPTKLIEILQARVDRCGPTVICYSFPDSYRYDLIYGVEALRYIDDNGVKL